MTYTTDPEHPDLTRGGDVGPTEQAKVYLVLSDEELAKGFVRPVRDSYVHTECGVETRMGSKLAETYAASPSFYGHTYCIGCRRHKPVKEFTWSVDGTVVGS